MNLPLKLNTFISQKYKPVLFILIGISIIFILAFNFINLTRYPPVFIDEPWTADIAWTRLTTGVNLESMHLGPLSQFGYEWILRPFIGMTPFVWSFSLLGLGLFQARLVSFVFGVILILAIIIVGTKSYGFATGILAALFLSLSEPFLNSSHWARQDVMLAAMIVIAYGLAMFALQKEKWWAHLLSGIILGFSLDIHENAALFFPALAGIYLINYRSKIFKSHGVWLVALGGALGVAFYFFYHIFPNPGLYQKLNNYDYSSIHQLPIQQLSISSLLTSLDLEIGRYHFYENNLDFALIGASVIYLVFRRLQSDRLLLTFTGMAFLSFVLFQGSKYDQYAILFYPFFILMTAVMFASLLGSLKRSVPQMALIITLLGLFIVNSTLHFFRPIQQSPKNEYNLVIDEINSVITPNSRVLGSPNWWFGLYELNYQSYKTLQFYKYFNNYSLTKGLEILHPDILIVDPFMELQLFGDPLLTKNLIDETTFNKKEFTDFLSIHGRKLAEYNDPVYGLLQVYSIVWK